MSRWNQKTTDVKLIANYIPACNESWGQTGSCTVHTENPFSFARRLPKNKLYNLSTEVYVPEKDSILPFEEGELEHIGNRTNETMRSFSYELKALEIPGKNLRKLYSNTAVAFSIGVVACYTWWWLFFTMPYWCAAGMGNFNKNKSANKLPNYYNRKITIGKDNARIDAVNDVCEFHNNLPEEDYIKKLQLTRNYCLGKEDKNPAYKELTQGYRDLLEANLEDSFILKRLSYNHKHAFRKFFLDPFGIIPEAVIPKQLVKVRNLEDNALKEISKKYYN